MAPWSGTQFYVLNVKALVGAFNQEKALVGAGCETDGSFYSTSPVFCSVRCSHSATASLGTETGEESDQRPVSRRPPRGPH